MWVRELWTLQSGDCGSVWKYQFLLGVLLVLGGLLIAVFPEILVALAAAAVILAGVGLIGSAWRLRRLEQHRRRFAATDVFEW